MQASTVLRPGLELGLYPEREDPQRSKLERVLLAAADEISRRNRPQRARYRKIIRAINRRGATLSGLSDEQLRERCCELRFQLQRTGLCVNKWLVESFALIRETAQRTLQMRHFDVQLTGGWVMLQGMVAEMETGEGKTLTATLPACTAALAGIPVHIITVNDYLVARDAQWMLPLYQALGLSVGTIVEGMDSEARRAAYRCDVTYCTNKQVAFDYLKDRIVLGNERGGLRLGLESLYSDPPRSKRLLLPGLCFGIVDEADSVLIDEARTPLIISAPRDTSGQREIYEQTLQLADVLQPGIDFDLNARERSVKLTAKGKTRLAGIAQQLQGQLAGSRIREELVSRALSARHLFHRDEHYLLSDGKVQIIDSFTGRVMPDRSWEQGLHQLIEVKEGCSPSEQNETLARISYQRFYRRYLRLAGMSGTCREVAPELWSVYRLKVVTVPTNRPLQRERRPDRLYVTADSKWNAILETIRELHSQGRPVLVGTRSVASSEHLSRMLVDAGLVHQVLNARKHALEAGIIKHAGAPAAITVATNMAGRGTDIRLGDGVAELGGLHVITTERHEARRIDRQLSGRCGRQGDPGSYQVFQSLEDELYTRYCPPVAARLAGWRRQAAVELSPAWLWRGLSRWSQRVAERDDARIRRALMKLDENLGSILAFSGRPE
jgi:preprotein translocase subunit SecA